MSAEGGYPLGREPATTELASRWSRRVAAPRPWTAWTSEARVAYAGAAAWVAVFSAAGILRHAEFQSARYDLGDMTQALWNTAHGRFLASTLAVTGQEVSRLGVHVDPLLALLTPLWWIWPSPVMLIVVSVVSLGLGTLPVFWLARKHTGSERTARNFALAYLLVPMTQWNALDDFHPVSLAIPLILFAVWFLDEDRLLPFATCGLLAAASKEEIPLAVGLLGIWYAVSHRRAVAGAVILAAGAAATAVDFFVVMPYYSTVGQGVFADRYAAVGGSAGGIAHTAATDPVKLVETLATLHNLGYVLLLAIPFCFLFVASPLIVLAAVPDLLVNCLSGSSNQTSISLHYTAGIYPFLLCGAIVGAGRMRSRLPLAGRYVLIASAIFALHSPLMEVVANSGQAVAGSSVREARRAALAMIPPNAAVTASNHLGAHLSARRRLYDFPNTSRAQWVVVDESDGAVYDRRLPGEFRADVAKLAQSPVWRRVFSSEGILVFRRRPPPS
jgi:uncharacterized membrane protein